MLYAFKYLLGGSGDIFTGIGIFFFWTGASENNLTGIGMVSVLVGAFGKSLLDLKSELIESFLGITLAGEADWRRNLLGESDLVLDLQSRF